MPARFTADHVFLLCALAIASTATAQESEPPPPDTSAIDVLEEVRVVAPRMDFGVSAYIEADVVLGEDSIRSFAVDDLGELLDELAPDLDSGRGRGGGRRVVLVNGQRIANFSEIRRYPTESVDRVEIYPEEVALQYGFRADQKVVNFVLKPRFRAVISRFANTGFGETDGGGGGERTELSTGFLRVRDAARMNLDLTAQKQSALHDSDRDVPATAASQPGSLSGNLFALGDELSPGLSALAGEPVRSATLPTETAALELEDLLITANAPVVTDVRPFRTLLPDQNQETLSGSYANLIGDRISGTLSGSYTRRENRSEQGLAGLGYRVPGDHPLSPFAGDVEVQRLLPVPLTRTQDSTGYEINATLAASWRGIAFSWFTSYLGEDRDTVTKQGVLADAFLARVDALDPSIDPFSSGEGLPLRTQFDSTRSRTLSSELLARGVLMNLPQGPVQGSASLLWRGNTRRAETRTGSNLAVNRVDRDIAELHLNLDAPLFKVDRGGRLSLNINAQVADYSDFGALSLVGTGFTWNPGSRLRLTTSLTREEVAPSMEQLGDPITAVPNRRTFDFQSGGSVDALEVSGGNPELRAESRNVLSVSARFKLLKQPRLNLTFDYVDTVTEDPILRFPNQSAEVETAFPARYERDDSGTLVAFDTRPINLEEERRSEIRWALRYSHQFSPPSGSGISNRRDAAREQRGAGSDTRERGGKRGGAAKRSSRDRGPRLRLALNHVITLEDELRIAPGLPPIDYVGVANAGRRRGGARHVVTLRGTYAYRGFAGQLNASWQDATRSLPNRFGTLGFDDLFRADLDLAYTFRPQSSWVQRLPALEGTRVKLSLINVFDRKPRVTDQTGATPLGFTEDELAPLGRHFALELRKLFL